MLPFPAGRDGRVRPGARDVLAATHTVAPGETLWGIASANNLATSAVAAANGLSPRRASSPART